MIAVEGSLVQGGVEDIQSFWNITKDKVHQLPSPLFVHMLKINSSNELFV